VIGWGDGGLIGWYAPGLSIHGLMLPPVVSGRTVTEGHQTRKTIMEFHSNSHIAIE
jgi:hypothetical protein